MSQLSILLIRLYQKTISPVLQGSCRHYPTCSHYSMEAFRIHGFAWGIYLTTKRILKCNPFFEGGYDPVPGKEYCNHNFNNPNNRNKF
ncbi:MAG: membrane protein insertion efficiency factor YidD [bacterium]